MSSFRLPLHLALALILSGGCGDKYDHEHTHDTDGGSTTDGSDGTDGTDGADGTDGTDGADGTDTTDEDGDGVGPDDGDCDDDDPTVFPGATDSTVDGTDQDCDGLDGPDADGDGVAAETAGGTDCDDSDAAVQPGATDLPDDGIDQDCDGEDATTGIAGSTTLLAEVVLDSDLYCRAGAYSFTDWDWDGDGASDLVVNDGDHARATILYNDGGWTLGWTSPTSFQGPSSGVGDNNNMDRYEYFDLGHTTHDWDGDGDKELVVVGNGIEHYGWTSGLFRETGALVDIEYLRDGGSSSHLSKMAVASFNFDGVAPDELIVGSFYGVGLYEFDGETPTVISTTFQRLGVTALAPADWDGDGQDEVLMGTADRGYLGVWLNLVEFDGDGELSAAWSDTEGIDEVSHIVAGDVDGDGDPDALVTGVFGAWLYENDGTGSLSLSWIAPEAAHFVDGELADIDGDSNLDILLPSDLRRFRLFLGDGAGGFTELNHGYTGEGRAVAAHDFDGDGVLDITFANFAYDTVTATGRNTCTISTVAVTALR